MSKATKEKSSQVAQSAATVSHGKSTETTLRDLTKAFADVHTILLALQQEVREIKHNLAQQNKAISAPSVIAKESLLKDVNKSLLRDAFRNCHEPSKPQINALTEQIAGNKDAELFKATKKQIKTWFANQRSYFRSRIRFFAKQLNVNGPFSRDVLLPIVFAYHGNAILPTDYEIERARVALQKSDEESTSTETAPNNNNNNNNVSTKPNKRKAAEVFSSAESDAERPKKKIRGKNGRFTVSDQTSTSDNAESSRSSSSEEEDD